MNESSKDRHQRLALAAAVAWKEVSDFMRADPDMGQVQNQDMLFRLQSAAEQAGWAYWENVDTEDAEAEPE